MKLEVDNLICPSSVPRPKSHASGAAPMRRHTRCGYLLSIIYYLLSLIFILQFQQSALADSWTWRMPVKYYQQLDFEHRAAIDRARDAYIRAEESTRRNESFPDKQLPLYRAAAAEWEKYRVQFELDNEFNADAVNAYVEFMHAYSLQGARDRNKAIKKYQELLDLYPEETWITAAAQYMIGANQLANGENSRAKNTFLAMVEAPEKPQWAKHPLACNAYLNIGDFYWGIGKYNDALEFWKQGLTPEFKQSSKETYDRLHRYYRAGLALTEHWNDLTELELDGLDPKNTKGRAKAIVDSQDYFRWWQNVNWFNDWYWNRRYIDKEKDKTAAYNKWLKGFADWHESTEQIFKDDGRDWQYVMRKYLYRVAYSKDQAKKVIPDLVSLIKASPDDAIVPRARELFNGLNSNGQTKEAKEVFPEFSKLIAKSAPEEAEKRAKEIIKILSDCGMFIEARTLLPHVRNKIANLWSAYGIDLAERKYKDCVISLEGIIASPDPEASLSGKKTLAWLYRERMGEYAKAVKLLEEINQPPGTLWDIQWCYRRMGEKKKAQATLDEITFFPDHAARAVWTKAEYFREDGEKDMAVALYRRLLSQPEWKKTQESSWAHQKLEAWGIATGGAVINEVR